MLLWIKEHHIFLEKHKKAGKKNKNKKQGTDSIIASEWSILPKP